MCGFFEFDRNLPKAKKLFVDLDLESLAERFRPNTGVGPASSVDIILKRDGIASVQPAIWWLLLDKQTLKPSKYTSFNTRSDKLKVQNSAGFHSYRHQRCVIPATGIVEGEGVKGQRKYHLIEPLNTAFALGGLYKEWVNNETGELTYSCSVITLPPHPKWKSIHSKSTPFFLPGDMSLIEDWLDPEVEDVDLFTGLLQPMFYDSLLVTKVDRPSTRKPMAESFLI